MHPSRRGSMRGAAGRGGGAPYNQSTKPFKHTNKAIITLPSGSRPVADTYIYIFSVAILAQAQYHLGSRYTKQLGVLFEPGSLPLRI